MPSELFMKNDYMNEVNNKPILSSIDIVIQIYDENINGEKVLMLECLDGEMIIVNEENIDYINGVREDILTENKVILMNKYINFNDMSAYYIPEIKLVSELEFNKYFKKYAANEDELKNNLNEIFEY